MNVSSPLPAWLLNTFDLPVRFLYNRAGPISWMLQKVFFSRFKASQPEHIYRIYSQMAATCADARVAFEGAHVLELGPGNSRLNALRFLLDGASHVTLVDKFPRSLPPGRQAAFFRAEVEHLREALGVDSPTFVDGDGIAPDCATTIDADLRSLELTSVDFLYSVDVLEHVRPYASVIEKTFDVLRPGGYAYHVIDMRDHYNFARPFLFYKYSNQAWDSFLTKEGWSYWNRARYGEFRTCFSKSGFEIATEQLTRLPMRETRIDEVFGGRDDLDVAIAAVLLRKPG